MQGRSVEHHRRTETDHASGTYSHWNGYPVDIGCQAYVRALEEMSGARISVIGVGPGRDQSIVLNDLLA